MFKRMSPAPVVPARTPTIVSSYNSPTLQQRGTSPVSSVSSSSSRQPMIVQNGPQVIYELFSYTKYNKQTMPLYICDVSGLDFTMDLLEFLIFLQLKEVSGIYREKDNM